MLTRVIKHRATWVVLAVAAIATGVWLLNRPSSEQSYRYKTVDVVRKTLVGWVSATGTLSARITVQVGTQVSGRVSKVLVDFDDKVKKGQLLAEIDRQLFRAALDQNSANLAKERGNVAKALAEEEGARIQLERSKQLRQNGLMDDVEFQNADTRLKSAMAQVQVARGQLAQAQANYDQARLNLELTSIFSPIDGVVLTRTVDVGQTVASSLQAPTLFTIAADLREMQVDTFVTESDIGHLRVGLNAEFSVDAFPGRRFTGVLTQLRNASTEQQGIVTYKAILYVDNPALMLRPGMTANVKIPYETKSNVLAVPMKALRFRPPQDLNEPPSGGAHGGKNAHGGAGASNTALRRATKNGAKLLWLLRKNKLVSVPVRLGLGDGQYAEVISDDIQEGDKVVTEAIATEKRKRPVMAPGF